MVPWREWALAPILVLCLSHRGRLTVPAPREANNQQKAMKSFTFIPLNNVCYMRQATQFIAYNVHAHQMFSPRWKRVNIEA